MRWGAKAVCRNAAFDGHKPVWEMQSEEFEKAGGFVVADTYGRTRCNYRQRRKSKGYRPKLVIQKLMGFVLLVICGLMVLMAYHGQTVEDKDCTAVVLLAPLAFYLLFAKEIVIH